jgi:hypothetical protein
MATLSVSSPTTIQENREFGTGRMGIRHGSKKYLWALKNLLS